MKDTRPWSKSSRRLRAHPRATASEWEVPTESLDNDTLPSASTESTIAAPGLRVMDTDLVIQLPPVTPVYPTITHDVHAQANLDADARTQAGSDSGGSPSSSVAVPSFLEPEISLPTTRPPALPLSQSFLFERDQPRRDFDERTIPIRKREYAGWGDMEYSRPVARIKGLVSVDVRTSTILTTTDGIPTYYIQRFTLLGGILDPYVFPSHVDNTPNSPTDIPPYAAYNWPTRLAELHSIRRGTQILVNDVIKCLTNDQQRECTRATISIFRLRDGRLIPTETNRATFFERLHPSFNAAVTRSECAFLRSAIYILRDSPFYTALADAVNVHLRTSHYDTWLITELIAMDCLGNPTRDDYTLSFIERVENERLTDHYEDIRSSRVQADKRAQEALDRAKYYEAQTGSKRRHSESSSESDDED